MLLITKAFDGLSLEINSGINSEGMSFRSSFFALSARLAISCERAHDI